MSAITDVGVNFKFDGGADFENRLKTLESSWKSFSDELKKSPEVGGHFQKMGEHVSGLKSQLGGVVAAGKAALAALLAFEGAKKALSWVEGSEGLAKERAFTKAFVPPEEFEAYKQKMLEMHQETVIPWEDAQKGIYQINSAMSESPLDERLKTFEHMADLMFLLKGSFEQATIFWKKFMAETGHTLPEAQQKGLAKQFNEMLFKIAETSSADPKEIPMALAKIAPVFNQLKLGIAKQLATLAVAIPQFQSSEMAGTAIVATLSKSGEVIEKLAASAYEQSYLRGAAFGPGGRSRDFKTEADRLELKYHAASPLQREQIEHRLSVLHKDMEDQKKIYSLRQKEQAMQLINQGDLVGYYKLMKQNIDQIQAMVIDAKGKKTGAWDILAKDIGVEHIAATLTMIDDFVKGDIPRMEGVLKTAAEGMAGHESIAAAKKGEPHEAVDLVKQAMNDLSATFKPIFAKPLITFLEGWKTSLAELRKSFEGPEGIGKLKEGASAFSKGFEEGFKGRNLIEGEGKSLAQQFQDFVKELGVEEWNEAGRTLGEATKECLSGRKSVSD